MQFLPERLGAWYECCPPKHMEKPKNRNYTPDKHESI